MLSCRLATAGRPGKLSAPHFPSLCHFWTCRGGNTFPSSAPCKCSVLPLSPEGAGEHCPTVQSPHGAEHPSCTHTWGLPGKPFLFPLQRMSPIAPLLSEQQYHLQVSPLSCCLEGFPSQPALNNKGTDLTPTGFALSQSFASVALCVMMHHCSGECRCTPGPTQLPSRMELVLLHPVTLLFFRAHRFHPKASLAHSPSQFQTRSSICIT